MRRLLGAMVAIGMVAWSLPALAHPHILIDAKARIVFDNTGAVATIHNTWTFDEAYSAWATQGLDIDNDGVTSRQELQPLADDNMLGLAAYQYYTFAGEGDGDNLRMTNGRNATLTYVDGQATLDFDVDLVTSYRIRKALEVAINDPEYYVAITFADEAAVTLENAPDGCAISLQAARGMTPQLAEQLFALLPDVTELPPELANAVRGVQGAILVQCPPGATGEGQTVAAVPADERGLALDAAMAMAANVPGMPFGGPPPEPGLLNLPKTGFFGWVAAQQRSFYETLTAALAALGQDANAFWVLGSLSFLYGVFHAAGPGHGKVVISTYVLANERQMRRGILLSFAAAMVQSLVAIGFVVIAAAVLNLTAIAMSAAADWIGMVSYGLVALLGLWLIARKVFGWGHSHASTPRHDLARKAHAHLHADDGRRHDADHGHRVHEHGDHSHAHYGEGHHHLVTPDQVGGGWQEQLGVVLAVGLRPCSGALIVLAFALSQGLLAAGMVAVLLMGLGTALTVAILASLAVGLKGVARVAAGANGAMGASLVWWAELAGAVLVFAFGVVLLVASL